MDILNRYYTRKCRVTWLINKRKKKLKSLREKKRSSSFNISFKKTPIKNDDEIEIEIELDIEIKKIKLENELIGYYFYFNPINKENKMENNRIKFIEIDDDYNMNMHLKLPEFIDHKLSVITDANNFMKTQILSDPTAFVADKTNNQIRRKSCYEYNAEKDLIIGPDYISKSPGNFNFDLNTLSYIYSTDRNNYKTMNENLKRDVITKIKINQFQYNSIKNRKKIFSLSQIKRHESTTIQEVSSSSVSSSDSNTNSGSSSYTSGYSDESSSSFVLAKKKSIPKNSFKLGYVRRSSKNVMTEIRKSGAEIKEKLDVSKNDYLSIISKNIALKGVNQTINSMEFINNYYSLNLNMNNIHFLIFDFYKEIFVEKKDIKKVSSMELILRELKNGNLNCFGDNDEKYPMIVFESQNIMKKGDDEKKFEAMKIEEKKIKTKKEEQILEKKIKYSINSEKDEIPIQRLKIYSIVFCLVLMILLAIFYIYFMDNYSKIRNILTLIKDIIKIKYCNRMSVFFVGESTLLNFNASKIVGGLFTNFPGKSDNKKAYIQLMRDKIKETYFF